MGVCFCLRSACLHSHGTEKTKTTGRPQDLSINKITQAQSLAVMCACYLLACSGESPQNCAPLRNCKRLCCFQTTEATRVQSNPAPQGKTSPRPGKSAHIGGLAQPCASYEKAGEPQARRKCHLLVSGRVKVRKVGGQEPRTPFRGGGGRSQ